ncbi:type II toxin-antitoxin system YafQ family toxin [Apilactobacillus sp. M161]|uniref:Type II toxin-antitoxin system YafQ family toxin n=1 Tax=Apilactobacillus xinyiensis TaxID=2841032 RepID=A0ABT0I3D6_9LACO|nr:type II toxin-antitoxin system YafQ family toxin [Apilactobacillus xinyiensis]MCK8625206.1 type II toxin-antitoxin system YafQ family toxin [Apilactobacillus xinyiensis]
MKIKYTQTFKRDYKRFNKKHYDMSKLDSAINAILEQNKNELIRFKDHRLIGEWSGFRELHLESNWLLIYRIEAECLYLTLTRLGSHNDLFK